MAVRGRSAFLALALALAACGDDEPQQSGPAPFTSIPEGPACLASLNDRGADFVVLAEVGSGQCRIATPIALTATRLALDQPATIGCPLAVALDIFERRVIVPAAEDILGQSVVGIRHFGAYACRGRSGNARRLSEHARGRAIDVAGFELADGTVITVEEDWNGSGAASRFLHAVARAACERFSVVLSPDHDRDHHDHLHLDIGPYRLCGA
jgi:hypothetical protein